MAGMNATEIRVAGNGKVLIAAKNTDMPVPGTPLGAAWKDLGYTTNDGIKLTKKDKLDPVDAWQSQAAVRFIQSDRDLTVKFQLMQVNVDTLPFVMGSGATPLTPTDGVISYNLEATAIPAEFALGVEFEDGASVTRFYIPRAIVTDMDEVQFAKNAPVKLGVTVNAIASDATPAKPLASWMAA